MLLKKIAALAVGLALIVASLTGCGGGGGTTAAPSSDNSSAASTESPAKVNPVGKVKIGVAIYDSTDSEVIAFQDYYKTYIGGNFENVEFLYSETISDAAKEIAFIETCKTAGVQGVISFVSFDTVGAIDKCTDLKMYYIKGAASVTDEIYEQVKDSPYFLGTLGASLATDRKIGYQMAKHFIEKNGKENKSFVIHAGFIDRVEMHRYRLAGMVDAFAEIGITYSEPDPTTSTEIGTFATKDGYIIDIFKGVPIDPTTFFPMVSQKINVPGIQVLLSTMSGVDFLGAPIDAAETANNSNIQVGVVSSFTNAYYLAFNEEVPKVDFIAAKYAAEIGPAFAAMYNAISGSAEDFRDGGNPFRLEQGYWVATSTEEYNKLYDIATSLTNPAYSADDLKTVIKEFNPNASYADFKALAEAWDIDDVNARLK